MRNGDLPLLLSATQRQLPRSLVRLQLILRAAALCQGSRLPRGADCAAPDLWREPQEVPVPPSVPPQDAALATSLGFAIPLCKWNPLRVGHPFASGQLRRSPVLKRVGGRLPPPEVAPTTIRPTMEPVAYRRKRDNPALARPSPRNRVVIALLRPSPPAASPPAAQCACGPCGAPIPQGPAQAITCACPRPTLGRQVYPCTHRLPERDGWLRRPRTRGVSDWGTETYTDPYST